MDNPFYKLTMPEMYGWLYKEYGEEGFRQVIEECLKRHVGWKESHENYAKELRAVGLNKVADTLEDYIPRMKSLRKYLEDSKPKCRPPEYYKQ